MRYVSSALIICLLMVSMMGCSGNVENPGDSAEKAQTNADGMIEKQPDEEKGEPQNDVKEKPLEDVKKVTQDDVKEEAQMEANESEKTLPRDMKRLSNLHATSEAVTLYNYIRDIYGKSILSGQQESTWMGTPEYEMNYIKETTGKLPAIRGLDYINNDFMGVTRRSIEWWNQGGIVSICWHWGMPPYGVGYESSKGTIDLNEALTEGTDLHKGMIAQMDRVAEELKILQDAGVPVLWRPFHEFDGAWFWWGKGGAENFKKLWRLMYDRYTNVHGLNNLIWVLGYSNKVRDGWYPGDAYVDIAGADNYSPGTQIYKYNKIAEFVGTEMPIAYHENGPIPDPDGMIKDGAKWVWFLTWHTIHIKEQNTAEDLNAVYNHEYVITLDELPDLKSQ